MAKILVTDGHSRATLQIVRSLGRMGHEVHVSEKFRLNPSFYSKFAKKHFIYPDPLNEKEFIKAVKEYCKINLIEIIFPVVDDCLIAIVKNRKDFKNINIPFANFDKIDIFRDKLKTIEQCKKLGIPHPKTYFSENPNFKKISKDLGFPLILKPRKSSGSRGIELVKNLESFGPKFNKVRNLFGTPLIQKFIPNGGACGTEMLYSHNGSVANFSHYRIREYPESGGPSTYRKPINSHFLNEVSLKLLDSIGWYGPAMVEFRIDSTTGIPNVMEVNGRYWGSLACSIASGVDFPKYHYLMSVGEKFDNKEYDLNIKSRWEIGDLLWLFSKKGRFFDNLPIFLRGLTSDYLDFFQKEDPLPFVMSIVEAASYFFSDSGRKHSLERGW